MKAGTYLFDGHRITLTRDMQAGEAVRHGDLLLDGKLPDIPPDRRMPRILGRFISGGWRKAKPEVATYVIHGDTLGKQCTELLFRAINDSLKAGCTIDRTPPDA